jgi:hypothetical protein
VSEPADGCQGHDGREIATPAEPRTQLNLKGGDQVGF